MSAIQSHTITEAEENSFNFPPQPRLTQMNVRPDLLRQQGLPQLPPQMLPLGSPQFLPTQQQQGQQQQQHMGLLPASNSNQPIGLMGGAGPPNNNVTIQRYQQLQMQQQQANHRRLLLQSQQQQAQGLNQSSAPSGSHLGLPHSQLGFPGGMIQQPGNNIPVRRVSSQPQPLNQSPGHMSGGVGGMPMGMNPQTSMPGQLRQVAQQQMNARMQHQQLQGHLSPEMALALRQGNAGMPQNVARTSSAQARLLGGLSHPPPLAQAHAGGLQSSHHQNNAQNPIPHPHQPQISSSPRPGSHPQVHTPSNMPITTQGSSQGTANRSMSSDDAMFMNFPNSQFPPVPHNPTRLPGNNGQFSFVPSSTPPTQHGDAPQSISGGLPNPPGPGNRGGFQLTPAQQFEQMQQTGDNYAAHFKMHSSQANPSSRPTQHSGHHAPGPLPQQQQPQHHHSPHQQDSTGHISHPQRPQSQPTAQPGRPPSVAGPSHTPHVSQSQLPANTHPPGRIPSLPPQQQQPHGNSQPSHQPQLSTSTHPLPIAPRPSVSAASGSSTTVSSAPLSLPEGSAMHPHANQRAREMVAPPVGLGQGLLRLLQFSGMLSNENKTKLQLSYWDALVNEYFTPKAVMKFTLWKDNQRNEAKPFEIGVPILPRFFLVTTQSGVKSMTLSLDGARERFLGAGRAIVECTSAVWTYKYSNGYTVTLRGPLTAHVTINTQPPLGNVPSPQSAPQQLSYSLKFETLQFDANFHDKYIALESVMGQRIMESPKTPRTRNAPTPTANGNMAQQRDEEKKWEEARVLIERASIPGEPVNAFGIPQATMRCLELAESVGQMADLISFSNETKLGPLEALTKFASKIRESQSSLGGGAPGTGGNINGTSFSPYPIVNGVMASPAVTLYSTAPPSANSASSSQTAQSVNSPQTRPQSADNSPQKQNKALPQPSQGQQSSSAPVPPSTPAAPGPGNTPSTSNATLKRKQSSETASPTTASAEQAPPAKRITRKRGRTTGGG